MLIQMRFLGQTIRRFNTSSVKGVYHVDAKNFLRDYIEVPKVKAEKHAKLYNNAFYFVMVPLLLLSGVNAAVLEYHHFSHYKRPRWVGYDHLYAHVQKKYPWGDGRRSLFFNDKYNATPTGYIDEE